MSRSTSGSGPRGRRPITRRRLLSLASLVVLAAAVALLVLERGGTLLTGPVPTPTPTVAFGSRPEAKSITCRSRTGVTIRNRTFRGIGHDVPAISVLGCKDVVIEDNDFVDDAEPIYVQGSTNVVIRGNRYRNITGPHERNGSHRGNFTQWDSSFGGRIVDNIGVGGDTEDVVSIYRSGGRSAADPLVIAGNRFEGTDWTSTSGSGILLGDGGGAHIVVRDNVLVNIGQVGIGIAGGDDIHVLDNTILSARRSGNNVGVYAWGQGTSCSDIEIRGNRVSFVKEDGTKAPIYDAGNCGPVAGLSANQFEATLSFAALRVRL